MTGGRFIRNGQPCTRCNYQCRRAVECNCCPWCCVECNREGFNRCDDCYYHFHYKRTNKKDCHPKGCEAQKIQCPDIKKCQCTCCKEKCSKQLDQCSFPAAQLSLSSTGIQSQSESQALSSDRSTDSSFTDDSNEEAPPPSPPDPQAIAAVIVGIIVAIILLDLCIFRFPVGRNIRDFLVRKIPFCIAFYS